VLRIVQEGLTNVTKHARPGARTVAQVDVRDRAVHVLVTDDGGGGTGNAPELAYLGSPPGHGLTGLGERVGLLGGTVSAGPVGSGWRLAVELPLDGDTASASLVRALEEPTAADAHRPSPATASAPR
jgi:signal transduction histidine kinase